MSYELRGTGVGFHSWQPQVIKLYVYFFTQIFANFIRR